MRERYLQSLAILLAGLFSAERFRSVGSSSEAAEASSKKKPSEAAAARGKATEN